LRGRTEASQRQTKRCEMVYEMDMQMQLVETVSADTVPEVDGKAVHCPCCGEPLMWSAVRFRVLAGCCSLQWSVDEEGKPYRTWRGLPYREKRIENYLEWEPRSKRRKRKAEAGASS